MFFGFKVQQIKGKFMKKKTFDLDTDGFSTPYKAAGAFTASMLAVIVAYLVAGIIVYFVQDKIDITTNAVYVLGSFFIISLALAVGTFMTYQKQKLLLSDVTEVKFSKKYIAVIALIAVGALFGLSSLNDYFVMFLEKFGYVADNVTLPQKSFFNVVFSVVFIALIPAIVEEFLFRGVMLKGCENFGKIQAVLVTAAAFSLYHMSPAQTIYQFIIGVIYAIVALTSKSIIPTTILHFLNNFLIITWNYLLPDLVVSGAAKIILCVVGIFMVAAGIYLSVKGFDFKDGKKQYKKADVIDYLIAILPGFAICLVMWIANLFA